MYSSLGFVLSKWRIAGSKKFNREGGQGMSLARDQPTHVMKTCQMNKNAPQKPSRVNLIQVGNKG